MDPNNRSLFAARNEKKTYILKVPLIIVPDRVPETWVLGFWKVHGGMGLKDKLIKAFVHFLPNFWHSC